MADKRRGTDTVNAVQATDQNSSGLGLEPVIPLPSPPSRTTDWGAVQQDAADDDDSFGADTDESVGPVTASTDCITGSDSLSRFHWTPQAWLLLS